MRVQVLALVPVPVVLVLARVLVRAAATRLESSA